MTEAKSDRSRIRSYFVDEAGDPTLFGSRGKQLVGTEGCSKFFILGKLDIRDPEKLSADLTHLRTSLLADPYFQGAPSMQPEQRKTAIAFHAKDDVPEVRREVLKLLSGHDMQFYALVRDKRVILEKVLAHRIKKPRYRYHPNQLYDRCVSQLFHGRIHKDSGYGIHFARRGNSDRTAALRKALESARDAIRKQWGIVSVAPIEILPAHPAEVVCLQAVDYFLWALQRFCEMNEERFLKLIWPQTKLVVDYDDTREKAYGMFYTQSKPLTLDSRAKK